MRKLLNIFMRKKNQRISHLIIGIVMPAFCVFLILLFLIDIFAIQIDKKNNIASIQQSLALVSNNIKNHIDAVNQYLYTIYEDNKDLEALTHTMSYGETFSHAAELNSVLKRYFSINNDLDGYFIVYGSEQDIIGYLPHEVIPQKHQKIIKQQSKGLIGTTYFFNEYILEISEKSYYISSYQSGHICIVFITDLMKYITELEKEIPFEGKGYILFSESYLENRFHEPVLHFLDNNNSNCVQHVEKADDSCFVGHKVKDANFWLLYEVENSKINRFSFVTYVLIIMTIVLMVCIVVIYIFIRLKIVHPMYALVDMMRNVKTADANSVKNLQLPYYEMQLMNDTIIDMVSELRLSKEHFYEEKINRQTAELQFLQAQLKPHFYLNCLKMLNAKAHDAGLQEMQDLILLISDYLRNCLGSVKNIVPLEEELELTEKYVELQKKLSSRMIECTFSVEEHLRQQPVPMFCVQSFVENSIKYAQNEQNIAHLHIQVIVNELQTEDGVKLDIIVMDSGQGYDVEKLSLYNEKGNYDSDGVGINNIKRRCDVLYGNRAEYMFYNLNGAVSELILPLDSENL